MINFWSQFFPSSSTLTLKFSLQKVNILPAPRILTQPYISTLVSELADLMEVMCLAGWATTILSAIIMRIGWETHKTTYLTWNVKLSYSSWSENLWARKKVQVVCHRSSEGFFAAWIDYYTGQELTLHYQLLSYLYT